MPELSEAQQDALDLAKQITEHAQKYGWSPAKGHPKTNKKFAFVLLRRDLGSIGVEELKAFYAVDPDADSDQVTYTDPNGDARVLDPESGDVREQIENDFHIIQPGDPQPEDNEPESAPDAVDSDAVPPTSAAHSAAHTDVPPTDAAHTDSDSESAAHSAAHTEGDHLPSEEMEAIMPIEDDVPPTVGKTVPEHVGMVPEVEARAIADEAQAHQAAAEKAKPKDAVHPTWSQQDTYAAVRSQQANPSRNWSGFASPLTSAEILTKLGVNRKTNNRVEVVWLNALSGSLDRAIVDGDGGKYPPHITPAEFDPEEHGEDLRILHFLQVGGGFRSVAVCRIKKIG
ncbi:hypothetical protein AU099_gp67 [Gordonia phage GTE8]|uniref:Uncharacterized protein n=1 Tax=Gordonia phage GTE8 TaxID=1647475 RepID=A0A0K0N6G7_9CAUD|nr:hypothetical protein AU099_gp67 [Gordonia phage GTE8]AKJ72410.1 hypothetical protein GTE8_67 [Gordonia phage GTE8]